MEVNLKKTKYDKYRRGVTIKRLNMFDTHIETHTCCKCGRSFIHETMWSCSEPSMLGFIGSTLGFRRNYGCTHCFPTLDSFKTHCETNILLSEADMDNPLKTMF